MRRIRKIAAAVLIAAMLAGNVPVETVYAVEEGYTDELDGNQEAQEIDQDNMQSNETGNTDNELENSSSGTENENTETSTDDNNSASEKEETESDSTENEIDISEDTVTVEENTENESVEKEETGDVSTGIINFAYIESPYLSTPGTQRIVLFFDQVISGAEKVTLTVEHESGSQEEWAVSDQKDGLYLFEKSFTGAAYTGTYHTVSLNLYTQEEETTINLSDLGIEAEFGVNETYDGYEKLQPLEGEQETEELETSVVTIDENGVAQAQESIADALNVVSAQTTGVSAYSRSASNASTSRSGNIVVALDPGHDSRSTGASANGLREEVLTLKIANYCREELEKYSGVEVYMTRTGADCPFQMSGAGCIEHRVNAAAAAGAQIYVSFHLNSSTSSSAKGAEVIIPNKSWRPELSDEGSELARAILDELVKVGLTERSTSIYSKDSTDGGTYSDGSISDYYSVQRNCKLNNIPGIIIEHAFLTNSGDVNNFLNSEAGLKKLGVADATGIAQYLGLSKGEWVYEDGGWKYKVEGSFITNSFKDIGGKTYYFDETGIMQQGWQTIDGKEYYFLYSDPGVMAIGWQIIGGEQYYFLYSDPGVMVTGWETIGGKRYYFNETGIMQQGWQIIDGKQYYFLYSDPGVMVQGWQTIGGKQYYFLYSDPGVMVIGFETIGGQVYYFNSDGILQTGWQTINSKEYYFNETGIMQQGWQTIDGDRYYFLISNPGVMVTGFETIGGEKYYFNEEGVMQTGWQIIDGKRYYFLLSDPGVMVTGWETIGGIEYYFDENGVCQDNPLNYKGWQIIDGKTYYYDENGVMVTGWQTIDGKKYYFLISDPGVMVTGFETIGGKKYYFNEKGVMQTGWQTIDGKKYYFLISDPGVMVTGWETIGGIEYYFDENGVCQDNSSDYKGWQTINGKTYYYDENGVMVTGWQTIDGKKYYFLISDPGVMVTGFETIGGKKYYFSEEGVMQQGWQTIDGKKYYFLISDPGVMVTGFETIGGKKYYFSEEGVMQQGWQIIGGEQYYFLISDPGVMVTGWETIGGVPCYFGSDGVLIKKMDGDKELIEGETVKTSEQMAQLFENKNVNYPIELASKGAENIKEFCEILVDEANKENIRGEVLFAQVMLETGWLQFGGQVKVTQCNFGGIGAVDGGATGATFPDVRTGLRAQVQHLKAYANEETLNSEIVDPRFYLVTRGSAPYVEWLGIPSNPNHVGWASDEYYGYKIINIMEQI